MEKETWSLKASERRALLRGLALLPILALAAACGRKGDPDAPPNSRSRAPDLPRRDNRGQPTYTPGD